MKYMILLYGSQQDYDAMAGKPGDKPAMSAEEVGPWISRWPAERTELGFRSGAPAHID